MTIFAILTCWSLAAPASQYETACRDRRERAGLLIRNLNAMLKMNVELRFLDHSQIFGNTDSPPSLWDASASLLENGREIVRMPNPCRMKRLPSPELWLYVLAHEYGHKVIDGPGDRCFATFMANNRIGFSFAGNLAAENAQHANCDVFAAKALRHFGVDGVQAWKDLRAELALSGEELGVENVEEFRRRATYLERIWPTDFTNGRDFLPAFYFDADGLRRLDRLRPDVLADVAETIDGCHLFDAEASARATRRWKGIEPEPPAAGRTEAAR